MPTKSLSIALKSRLNSSAALRKNFTATGFNISRHYRRTLFLLLLFTFLFSHRRSGSWFFFQTGSLGQSPAAPAPPQQQEAEALPLTPLCVSANEGHSGCSAPKSAHTQSHTHLLPPTTTTFMFECGFFCCCLRWRTPLWWCVKFLQQVFVVLFFYPRNSLKPAASLALLHMLLKNWINRGTFGHPPTLILSFRGFGDITRPPFYVKCCLKGYLLIGRSGDAYPTGTRHVLRSELEHYSTKSGKVWSRSVGRFSVGH